MSRLSEARFYRKYAEDLMKHSELSTEQATEIALRLHLKDMKWKDMLDKQWEERYGKDDFEKGWFFLTIRPHNDFKDFNKFKNLVKRILSRKFIEKFKLVWEQKGETINNIGFGFHFHALLKISTPNKGIKYFINEFIRDVAKEHMTDVIASNCIDLKKINNQLEYDRREKYMSTDEFLKADEEKEKAWKIDRIWRKNLNLKDEYSSLEQFAAGITPPLPSLIKSNEGR